VPGGRSKRGATTNSERPPKRDTELAELRDALDGLRANATIDERVQSALGQIGSAAFIVADSGEVLHANAIGKTLLALDRQAVTVDLREAIRASTEGETQPRARYWASPISSPPNQMQ